MFTQYLYLISFMDAVGSGREDYLWATSEKHAKEHFYKDRPDVTIISCDLLADVVK